MHGCFRRQRLIFFIIPLLLSLFFFVPSSLAYTPNDQGRLLGSYVYLRSTNDTLIPSYKSMVLSSPTKAANSTFLLNASSSGIYLIDSWLLIGTLLNSFNLSRLYNFAFEMYGNSTGQGYFTSELLALRSGVEIALINRSSSEEISHHSTVTGFGWQYKTSQNDSFFAGDRLVLKLYFTVVTSGLFNFQYDSLTCRSRWTDPVEQRYLRDDQDTIHQYNATGGTVIAGTNKSTTDITTGTKDYNDGKNQSIESVKIGASNITSLEFTGTFSGFFNSTGGASNSVPFLQSVYAMDVNRSGTYQFTFEGWNYTSGTYQTSGEMYQVPTTLAGIGTKYYSYSIINPESFRSGSSWKIRINVTTTGLVYRTFYDYLAVNAVWHNLSLTYITSGSGVQNDLSLKSQLVGVVPYRYYNDVPTKIGTDSGVANVTIPASTGFRSNTWTPPSTSQVQSFMVKYFKTNPNAIFLEGDDPSIGGVPFVFMTEDLTDQTLDANTMTFYYGHYYTGSPDRMTYMMYGTTAFLYTNSTVTGFSHSTPSSRTWTIISTWTFSLVTRSWTSLGSWSFDLKTRAWTTLGTWTYSLITRSWMSLGSWTFDLKTRAWSNLGTWTFDLLTRQWRPLGSWTFNLRSPAWTVLSTWTFDLGREDLSFLIIPILFLACVCFFAFVLAYRKKSD